VFFDNVQIERNKLLRKKLRN